MQLYRKYSFILIGLILSTLLYSNLIDSITIAQTDKSLNALYERFIDIKSGEGNHPNKIKLSDKCGLDIINQIKINFDNFSSEQKLRIQSLLARPVLQTSAVSPSGYFRIHYDATGSNKPAYISGWSAEQNVAEVANVLDSVYRFEIDFLG